MIRQGRRITPEGRETIAYHDRRGTCTFCGAPWRLAGVGDFVSPIDRGIERVFLMAEDVAEPPVGYVVAHACC
ncbi:hypothetical protein [Kribbella sp.]|uniref:hypothetical protein n=1 Tax=Kribbella sp. TaxID=1871183 RepID=UPI002D2D3748|nr:hypothetical protein [Kribbella sp.]HZX07209.1 hypothetical protein [Kribbella sp.]